jgi:hypothetical protein
MKSRKEYRFLDLEGGLTEDWDKVRFFTLGGALLFRLFNWSYIICDSEMEVLN